MQFKVLGTLEVADDEGQPIDLGGFQQRAVLMMLLVSADRVVPFDSIIERLWPDGPPSSATGTLQSYVSRLRRALEANRESNGESRMLTWEAPGYRLHPRDGEVDFRQFEDAADVGRALLAQNSVREAHAVLTGALDLWRGPALLEFAEQPWARGIATRLDERRLAVIEDRIRADLLLGRHELVIGEISDLIDQHPLREGLWEHLAVALYRSGRQAEALRAIDDLRRQLVDELGVDPGPRIRELESQILGHDPVLKAPADVAAPTSSQLAKDASDSPYVVDEATREADRLERIGRHFEGLTTTELVGRRAERTTLTDALDLALKSRTQWVLLEGEPGIGKTRMLEFLGDEASHRGFTVLWGRSYESDASPAFWPWLPALRGLVDAGLPLPSATQELIERLLAPVGDEGLSPPVDAGRFRLFEAIGMLLQRAATRRPLMIALDDLQWADPASLELIEFLTGHVLGAPVLIAATVRELEIGRNDAVVNALAQLSRRPNARRIQLRGVDRVDSAELVRLAIGDQASPDVVEAIHQRSEGNPFFIGELARLLASEAGLTEAELVRRAAVPAGVRDVVHRRLVRLPAATAELVQLAATFGRETQLGLLSRASGLSIDQCIEDLDPALVNRLIVEVPASPGTIRFAHALVREVVLDDMSMLRRSRLHLRAADAIEATGRNADDDAEILAEHLWQAVSLGIETRATVSLERAAEVALRRFAYETADGLLERALLLRREMPPDQADNDAELDSLNRLTIVRRVRLGFERARVNTPIERAKELARQTGRELVLAELLWTEWAGAATACDFETSGRLAQEMLTLANGSADPLIRSTGHASWGIQCWHLGRISEAVVSIDRALAELDNDPDGDQLARGPLGGLVENQLLSRGFQVVIHELAGQPLPGGSPLPALAAQQADPYIRLVVWVCEALRGLIGGDVEASTRAAQSATSIEVGEAFEFFRAGSVCLLGCNLVERGLAAEGVATIERGVNAYSRADVNTVTPLYLATGCYGFVALGDLDRAGEWADEAIAMSERTGERWEFPLVLAAKAHVEHARGASVDEVADQFRAAHELALEQGANGTARRIVGRAADCGIAIT